MVLFTGCTLNTARKFCNQTKHMCTLGYIVKCNAISLIWSDKCALQSFLSHFTYKFLLEVSSRNVNFPPTSTHLLPPSVFVGPQTSFFPSLEVCQCLKVNEYIVSILIFYPCLKYLINKNKSIMIEG